MRCLALAQAWQDLTRQDSASSVTFTMAESTPSVEHRLDQEGMRRLRIVAARGSVSDSDQFRAISRTELPAWVVIDGYEFDERYVCALQGDGLKVLLMDDNGRREPISADVVLNQNLHAEETLYPHRTARTRLLLGTRYALLRREFRAARSQQTISLKTISPIGSKVLVSLGGSDPQNVTLRVLEAIEQVELDLEVVVVSGGSNLHSDTIAAAVSRSRHRSSLRKNVQNMQELMSWADLAISAAGSVCWEYCALGLPALLVTVAENQAVNARALEAAGAARLMPGGSQFALEDMSAAVTRLANSIAERQTLSKDAGKLVDGEGAPRVVAALM